MTEETLTTLLSSIRLPMTWKGLRLSAIAKSRTTIGGRTVMAPLLPGAAWLLVAAGRLTMGATGGRTTGGTLAGRAGMGGGVLLMTTGGRSALDGVGAMVGRGMTGVTGGRAAGGGVATMVGRGGRLTGGGVPGLATGATGAAGAGLAGSGAVGAAAAGWTGSGAGSAFFGSLSATNAMNSSR